MIKMFAWPIYDFLIIILCFVEETLKEKVEIWLPVDISHLSQYFKDRLILRNDHTIDMMIKIHSEPIYYSLFPFVIKL